MLTAWWSAPANAAVYNITYPTNSGASWSLGTMDHTQTSWTLDGTEYSPNYIVGVRARNANNQQRGWMNFAPAGPYIPPRLSSPATVASVSVTHSDGSLMAFWSTASSATSYHLLLRAGCDLDAIQMKTPIGNGGNYYLLDSTSMNYVKHPSDSSWSIASTGKAYTADWLPTEKVLMF